MKFMDVLKKKFDSEKRIQVNLPAWLLEKVGKEYAKNKSCISYSDMIRRILDDELERLSQFNKLKKLKGDIMDEKPVNYMYLDIETTGFDVKKDKITLISYAYIKVLQGEIVSVSELRQTQEWTTDYKDPFGGEKDMLGEFINSTHLPARRLPDCKMTDVWIDIPLGFNLMFDLNFIRSRCDFHKMKHDYDLEILSCNTPKTDLQQIAIVMNQCNFVGAGLDKMTGKVGDGKKAIEYYEKKEYDKLLAYNKQEFEEFLKWFAFLLKRLPEVRREYLLPAKK